MVITASDRSSLIRLASSLPVGDENRKVILAGLKMGLDSHRLPAQPKDVQRIEGILAKAGGDPARILRLSTAMAASIDDWAKAERRGSAARFHLKHLRIAVQVAEIFWDRADELKGGTGATVVPSFPRGSGRNTDAFAIPMGAVNLKTGDNRVFNFLETWGGKPHALTIAESVDDQRKIVIVGWGGPGSGYGRGTVINLISDQSRGFLGVFSVLKDVIGPMSLDLLKEVSHAAGKSSLPAYVLK